MRGPVVLDRLSALGDLTRSRLLLVLERDALTVGELCEVLRLPQSTVSRHLKLLADEGWVTVRAEGTSNRYRAALPGLDPSARQLWQLVSDEMSVTPAAQQDATRLRSVLAGRSVRSREFFATSAGQWDRLRAELFGARAELGALPALLDPDWTVADLGAGTGQVSASLAPFVRQIIAVDASEPMLEAARQRLAPYGNVELRRGDLEALPLDDGSIDAAVLSLALHLAPEPALVLAEAARVLRAGGRLLVVDMMPHERTDFAESMGHLWPGFDAGQIGKLASEAGFACTTYHPLPPDPAAKGPTLFAAVLRRGSSLTCNQEALP
ncbi:MAG: metalloregulator ArsR/SmtB family transcription factor [Gemmatimonadales bacterium]|nr:metalloregulator ArsR/SmtB family transcription factor [Gemmatimonadales bacterium]MDZ4389409.1 metalloregulator ArsR/SmtB family transcription factor [Gemmatimonadales bacterium]